MHIKISLKKIYVEFLQFITTRIQYNIVLQSVVTLKHTLKLIQSRFFCQISIELHVHLFLEINNF